MDKKIDNILLLEPFFQSGGSFHLREYARAAKMNHTTASKYLSMLVKDGLLSKNKERNHLLFSPTDNEIYRILKSRWMIDKIRMSGILELIDLQKGYPAIILFGSASRGTQSEKSDLDLCIISENTGEMDLSKYEKKIGYKIEQFIFTKDAFKSLSKKNKELANNIINGTVLRGFIEAY